MTELTKYSSSYTVPFFPRARLRSSRRRFLLEVLVPRVPVDCCVYRVKREPEVVASVNTTEISSGASVSLTLFSKYFSRLSVELYGDKPGSSAFFSRSIRRRGICAPNCALNSDTSSDVCEKESTIAG